MRSSRHQQLASSEARRTSRAQPGPRLVAPHVGLCGLLAVALGVGCATQTGRGAEDGGEALQVALELAPPTSGFQLETRGVTIDAGDDVRWCEVLSLPGGADEVYPIERIETALSAHGRELVLTVAELDSETASIMEPGARVPCLRAGEVFGEDLHLVTTSQQRYQDLRYPDGVGRRFQGGQRLAVEYHYVNDTPEPVVAKAKLNFHLTSAGAVERLAHTASFDNLTIYTPPAGSSAHLGECTVSQPLMVGELVRRTRHWGTDFRVWIAGGERDGELVWHSGDYRDNQLELSEPIALMPGEGFRFQCSYVNDSAEDLRAGTTATDELCSLQATFWTADPEELARPQSCLLLDVDPDGVARAGL